VPAYDRFSNINIRHALAPFAPCKHRKLRSCLCPK
jgi:hypothetical protein